MSHRKVESWICGFPWGAVNCGGVGCALGRNSGGGSCKLQPDPDESCHTFFFFKPKYYDSRVWGNHLHSFICITLHSSLDAIAIPPIHRQQTPTGACRFAANTRHRHSLAWEGEFDCLILPARLFFSWEQKLFGSLTPSHFNGNHKYILHRALLQDIFIIPFYGYHLNFGTSSWHHAIHELFVGVWDI